MKKKIFNSSVKGNRKYTEWDNTDRKTNLTFPRYDQAVWETCEVSMWNMQHYFISHQFNKCLSGTLVNNFALPVGLTRTLGCPEAFPYNFFTFTFGKKKKWFNMLGSNLVGWKRINWICVKYVISSSPLIINYQQILWLQQQNYAFTITNSSTEKIHIRQTGIEHVHVNKMRLITS